MTGPANASPEPRGSTTRFYPHQARRLQAELRQIAALPKWKSERPRCTRCASRLETQRLVKHPRRIVGVNAQAQSRVPVGASLGDERAHQGPPNSLSSIVRRNRETQFRSVGVDEPVGMTRWRPQPKPRRPGPSSAVLGDRGPIPLAAPAREKLREFVVASKLGERRPKERRIPEECLEQHGFKEFSVFRRSRSSVQGRL